MGFTHVGMLIACGVLLAGCGAQAAVQGSSSQSPKPATPVQPPAPAQTPTPPAKGVELSYEGAAQIELIAEGAPRVLVDVWDPSHMSAPAVPSDILLTTHTHPDHQSLDFLKDFPGTQLHVREGEITKPGLVIHSIAAAHSPGEPIRAGYATDYIFTIDIGGLRIAHFGDLGQGKLRPEQLQKIGHVDVAITQFENSFSEMDMRNKNGFKQMEQVKPRLILQTHSSMAAVKYARTLWPLLYSKSPVIVLTRGRIPATTTLLLLGSEGEYYAESVPAKRVKW